MVNYGASALIAANLTPQAVQASGCLVVITDNFSSAGERDAIQRLCAERGWHLVSSAGNDGFGAGVNRGVEAAIALGATTFVALNPDVEARGPTLRRLVERVEQSPSCILTPIIKDSSKRVVFEGTQVNRGTGAIRRGWRPDDDDPEWANWLSGACLVFSDRVFRVLGGFREDYFLYWEDVDFSRRAAEAGFSLSVARDEQVIHDEGGTQRKSGSRAKSDLYYYYNARNRLVFAVDHVSGDRLHFALSTPRESLAIWLRGGRRQLLTQPSGVWATAKGAASGLLYFGRTRPPRMAPDRGVSAEASRTILVAHPSPDLYGSDRVLLESVAGMVEAGHRVVAVLPQDGPLVLELQRHGAEVVFCPAPVLRKSALSPTGFARLLKETAAALPRARRALRETSADVLFVNTITNFVWLAVGRSAGVRVVCHVHEAERSAATLVRKGLYAPLLVAHQLVVNSSFGLRVIADTWPALAKRATIVMNGVPGPTSPSLPRAELDEVQLLFIGRLSPRKGPQVALEALRILLGEGRRAHLSILGAVFEGYEWFERELRDFVDAYGLSDNVTFLGFHPEVWEHLDSADIVLVPSTVDEPFGNTAVEAMLAQRPLVVSATSGLLEAADGYDTARRVPPSDARAIAGAVEDLLKHWGDVRRQTETDRERALAKHAPSVYRRALVACLFPNSADPMEAARYVA
ncbi:glycosyltransferase [Propioniciclava soli]|uniref:Glycosyltransferase n=1 Tax=Propioniciclava soli TaxID=2775081 RepID=A0ABZ3C848_9ACTN